MSDDFYDDIFHFCALTAFVQQARKDGDWPDPEAARLLAFRLYEEELAAKNASRPPAEPEAAGRPGHSADQLASIKAA